MRQKRFRLMMVGFPAVLAMSVVLPTRAAATSKYRTLYKFKRGADGIHPVGVILDAGGNLYGMTQGGGGPCNCGSVFKLAPDTHGGWTKTVLYSFKGAAKGDGASPDSLLIFDGEGNLYGTTPGGGATGNGTVFKLTRNLDGSWTESLLYTFCSATKCSDGAAPFGDLIFDQTGNLYGTTGYGGLPKCHGTCGTVFQLTPNSDGSWTESVLYRFTGLQDGAHPISGLTFDTTGNLYGTTEIGGNRSTYCRHIGCGVVFQLAHNPDGTWKENVLHTFAGRDGNSPFADLNFDLTGNLYGTTLYGGILSHCGGLGCGVVFGLSPNADGSWKETVLHQFTLGKDGGEPIARPIFDTAGNLYATTTSGGNLSCLNGTGCGAVIKLTRNANGTWKEHVLHSFAGGDGSFPNNGLVFDPAGNLYGTTFLGGVQKGLGVVFELTP